MSLVIASISQSRASEMVASGRQALANGADLIELRLDGLDSGKVATLLSQLSAFPAQSWIATCRSQGEGGLCHREPADRGRLINSFAQAGAEYVDLEFGDVEQAGVSGLDSEPATLIVSHHDLTEMPQDPASQLAKQEDGRSVSGSESLPSLIGKLAWKCGSVVECFKAFELMRALPGRRIVIAMGEKGLMTRVLAGKFGAFGTFCAPIAKDATAPGQVSLEDMLHLYRWRKQTPATRVLGVLGCPVGHSLSPAIFNAQFDEANFDGVYLPILIESEAELREFLEGCAARPWMDVLGFSVTVPHKRAALDWVGDSVEPLARRIGAVNTLHFTSSGVRGYNTDYAGALAAIDNGLGISDSDLKSLPVAVLGAGGVARAVVAGMTDRGASITIYNRSRQNAVRLAAEFDCQSADWDDRHRHAAKLIVNCTTLGMQPAVTTTPMPLEGLREDVAVFDTVYNPRETMLLKQARKAGAATVDGVAMFVHQAAAQYRIWTGDDANVALFERIVSDRLAQSRQAE